MRPDSYDSSMKTIDFIDTHTGGEPTRLVISGGPDLSVPGSPGNPGDPGNSTPGKPGTLAERIDILRTRHDDWRASVVTEPRGSDVIVGALLCEPDDPECAAAVIFFNNVGYLGMCGHGTIGLVVSLAYLGRIRPGAHRIQTPAGVVEATLNEDASVSVRNVPAYRYRHAVNVDVPHHGLVTGDVAWGGNWFFLVADHKQALVVANLTQLTAFTDAVRGALRAQNITGADGALIDHIELFADSPREGIDSRNFVLCPGSAYDRSPCGTGTSAKLACLAEDGKLAEGEIWRQESIIGSVFEASYRRANEAGKQVIIPTITGRAHIMAEGRLCFDPTDPFSRGIPSA
jgi:4-hydroxyproline epimerase